MGVKPILSSLVVLLSTAGAKACDLADPPLWESEGKVAAIDTFDFLAVVRFDTTQTSAAAAARQGWVDDVPSDTMGTEAICDRVQLETPLPMQGADDLPLTMMQGERLHPDTNLSSFTDLAGRIESEKRFVRTLPGPVFVGQVDLEDLEWRPKLLAAAANIGTIDTKRWMIGLPGGLYLVPLKP